MYVYIYRCICSYRADLHYEATVCYSVPLDSEEETRLAVSNWYFPADTTVECRVVTALLNCFLGCDLTRASDPDIIRGSANKLT